MGNSLAKYFYEPFAEAKDVEVVPVAIEVPDQWARAEAMTRTGNVEFDIVTATGPDLVARTNMLEKIDCSQLPSVQKFGVADACTPYGVARTTGGMLINYNTDVFKDKAPKTWADFWNVKDFPGRRALSNSGGPFATIVSALVADGVTRDKLFPLDLDRAFRKLDEIRPHIATWWRTGSQSSSMWESDDIAMALMWSGQAYATKKTGFPLAWSYEDTLANFGAWAILKNCPHPNAARAFINFYLGSAEGGAGFARDVGYATPNMAAATLMTPAERSELITTPEIMAKLIDMDPAWVQQNRARTLERWKEWISA